MIKYNCYWTSAQFEKESSFSLTRKIGYIVIIANFVFPYIGSFLPYLKPYHFSRFNVKLDDKGYKRITFQGCRLQRSCSFLIAELKQSWQYWRSCIVESLRKPLMSLYLARRHREMDRHGVRFICEYRGCRHAQFDSSLS